MDSYSKEYAEYLWNHDKDFLLRYIKSIFPDQKKMPESLDDITKMFELKQKEQSPSPITEETKAFKCKRCFSDSISVKDVQLRSADEGSTVILTCTKCGFTEKL